MSCVISGLVLTIIEITHLHTHCFDHQLRQPSISHLCFLPSFPCSHLVIPSTLSCFLLSSLSRVQSLPSTQVGLVSNKQIVFCSLSLICTAPLSCCIIYVCHYSPFEPQRHMLPKILLIFSMWLRFCERERDRHWYTTACLRGHRGCKGWVWCRYGTVN